MNRRSILAAYKKKSSHLQTGVTGFKSGNLFILLLHLVHLKPSDLTSPVFATIEMTAVVLYGAILQHPNAIVVLII